MALTQAQALDHLDVFFEREWIRLASSRAGLRIRLFLCLLLILSASLQGNRSATVPCPVCLAALSRTDPEIPSPCSGGREQDAPKKSHYAFNNRFGSYHIMLYCIALYYVIVYYIVLLYIMLYIIIFNVKQINVLLFTFVCWQSRLYKEIYYSILYRLLCSVLFYVLLCIILSELFSHSIQASASALRRSNRSIRFCFCAQ